MNNIWLIGSSIFGLIILGLGLALRFKIARDEKNGIYVDTSKMDIGSCTEINHEADWSGVNPATGFYMEDIGGIDMGGNLYGSDDLLL